jgi:hypothetical protein
VPVRGKSIPGTHIIITTITILMVRGISDAAQTTMDGNAGEHRDACLSVLCLPVGIAMVVNVMIGFLCVAIVVIAAMFVFYGPDL